MKLAMVGLGRMGANMAARLREGGHEIVAFDRKAEAVAAAVKEGARGAASLEEMVAALDAPRVVWIMVPAGEATETTIRDLSALLSRGDTVVDGGNSYYRDSIRRAAELERAGIHFVDAGTSGGIWGRTEGYSLMIGGDEAAVRRLDPVFRTLAPGPEKGWAQPLLAFGLLSVIIKLILQTS